MEVLTMEFQEVVKKRIGNRSFSDKQISEEDIRNIVADAERSPSWANAQATHVYVAVGETLKKIKAEHLAKVNNGEKANSDIPTVHRQNWGEKSLTNQDQLMKDWKDFLGDLTPFVNSQKILYDASAMVYLTVPRTAPQWALIDLGAFAQTLMLAACDRGIGSTPAHEIVKYPDEIRKNLCVPDDEIIAMGIALGYPTDEKINFFKSQRLPVDEVLTLKK
ncbi:MAG: nitroreductase [Synergistaceae bacterium]|nr:nitroreductase [Synergistaceae bacterium]